MGGRRDDPDRRRRIPSVDAVLRHPAGRELVATHRRERVVGAVRTVLEAWRHASTSDPVDPAAVLAEVAVRLASPPGMVAVVNATGIALHTNLGRASLAPAAVDAMMRAATDPTNLEIDLLSGKRGDRDAHVVDDLRALTGADAAVVVNNNAAAVLLVVNTFALGREAIVSRGELVEIGGSFRMPEVMARSGARLREVGTTNRTYVDDFRAAIGSDTALLLKVHTSNYRVVGFTASPSLRELAALGRETGIPVVEDLGSGALIDLALYGLAGEPVVRDRIADGADLVTFSGDKLLGGPQAGLIVGRRDLIAQVAANPLRRALRPDKLTYAALAATLRLYRDVPEPSTVLPFLAWLARPLAEMDAVGAAVATVLRRRLGDGYEVAVVASEAEVGSGAAPARPLPSRAVAIAHPTVSPDAIATRFRAASPPVLGRVHGGRFLLDLRGIRDPAVLDVELP